MSADALYVSCGIIFICGLFGGWMFSINKLKYGSGKFIISLMTLAYITLLAVNEKLDGTHALYLLNSIVIAYTTANLQVKRSVDKGVSRKFIIAACALFSSVTLTIHGIFTSAQLLTTVGSVLGIYGIGNLFSKTPKKELSWWKRLFEAIKKWIINLLNKRKAKV